MSSAAPGQAPAAVVDRLNRSIGQNVGTPEVRARLAGPAGDPAASTPADMQRKVTVQIAPWKDIAAKAGMQAQWRATGVHGEGLSGGGVCLDGATAGPRSGGPGEDPSLQEGGRATGAAF